IYTSDELRLARMCQLFLKVGDELELGMRLENAAFRFYHLQSRFAKSYPPDVAAIRVDKVSRAAIDHLESARKTDSIIFLKPKPRRPSIKIIESHPAPTLRGDFGEANTVPAERLMVGFQEDELVAGPQVEGVIPANSLEAIYDNMNFWDSQTCVAPHMSVCFDSYQRPYVVDPFFIQATTAFDSKLISEELFPVFPETAVGAVDTCAPFSGPQDPIMPQFHASMLVSPSAAAPVTETATTQDFNQGEALGEVLGHKCINCGVKSTPLWRFTSGRKRLCNACGLYYKMHQHQRPLALKNNKAKYPPYRPRALVCMDCDSQSTPLWRRDSKTGRPLCNSCGLYRRIKNQKRPEHLYTTKIKRRQRNNSPVDPSSPCTKLLP
ncbi:Vacuolar protein-sorting-associated protein 33, partial [Massospora cicadina]